MKMNEGKRLISPRSGALTGGKPKPQLTEYQRIIIAQFGEDALAWESTDVLANLDRTPEEELQDMLLEQQALNSLVRSQVRRKAAREVEGKSDKLWKVIKKIGEATLMGGTILAD